MDKLAKEDAIRLYLEIWPDMKEVCGTCFYNKRVFDGHCNAEFCCGNEDGDYYAVPTMYNDTCDLWKSGVAREEED